MDCAAFENGLVELLDDALTAADRRERAGRLARHAERCPACRGSLALVRDFARAPAERDPPLQPTPEQWQSFDRRLAEKIRAEERRRGRRGWLVAASAAAVVALLVGAWRLLPPAGRPTGEQRIVREGVSELREDGLDLPPELDRRLGEVPTRALGAFGVEVDPDGSTEDWVPAEVFDLDEVERRALLEWLERQNEALGGGRA